MVKSLKFAASKTYNKFIILLIVFASAIATPNIYDFYNSYKYNNTISDQYSVQIYSSPWDINWNIRNGSLVISASARKLENCHVIPRSVPVLVAYWYGDDSTIHSKEYPAISDGSAVTAAPRYLAGDVFMVGPWVINDTEENLNRIDAVSIKLVCEFDSGVRRYASIGPVEKPNEL